MSNLFLNNCKYHFCFVNKMYWYRHMELRSLPLSSTYEVGYRLQFGNIRTLIPLRGAENTGINSKITKTFPSNHANCFKHSCELQYSGPGSPTATLQQPSYLTIRVLLNCEMIVCCSKSLNHGVQAEAVALSAPTEWRLSMDNPSPSRVLWSTTKL